jgi:hypothetical protein
MSPDEPAAPTHERITGGWIWRAAWGVVIAVSAAWWWLMPGGFPAGHPRFWVNQVLPPLAVVVAVFGLTALRRRWTAPASASALTLPIALLAGTITGAALFPSASGACSRGAARRPWRSGGCGSPRGAAGGCSRARPRSPARRRR